MKRLKLFAFIALLFAPLLLSQQGYIPFATEFDGSSDFYLRGADLTGNVDGKTGIFSGWVRFDGGDGSEVTILSNTGIGVLIRRESSNVLHVRLENSASAVVLSLRSLTNYTASTTWLHMLASWDLAAAVSHLYVNDIDDANEAGNTNLNVDYTVSDYAVGARTDGSVKWNGALSEIYFVPNQFLDFSIESNRRLFITADLKPVDLGPGCYKPTGTVAIVCLQTQFNGFGQNSGSGGGFTPQDPVTDTAGPVPIDLLPGRAARVRGRGLLGRARR